MIPGLATEWAVDDADKTKWIFKLRPGVKFHDGSPFNADAVVWNVEKVLKQDAPHFDASQVGVTASRMPTLASARKIDDLTVELTTEEPDSFLPINLTNLFMASPAKWKKLFDAAEGADAKEKSQAAWDAFARDASGTGPWKMSKFTPRERLELVKNEAYWDKARVPKVDKMRAAADAGGQCPHRGAALRPGRLDRSAGAGRGAADQAARLRQLQPNEQPHVWPWQFSRIEGSPWNDIRVRKAANLCIDREGHEGRPARRPDGAGDRHLRARSSLARQAEIPDQVRSGGGAEADEGSRLRPEQEADGEDADLGVGLRPDAAAADERVSAAGAGANATSTSQLDVIEWNTLFTNWRSGAKDPSANGAHATNVTYAAMDPFFAMVRFLQSSMAPPVSNNWGFINDPKFDELVDEGAPDLRSGRARRGARRAARSARSTTRRSSMSRTTSVRAP